jgi:Domain of unknown function (DUF5658)
MQVNGSRTLVVAAALLIIFNLTDVLTTWFGISSRKAVEANPLVIAMGGPFSPLALTIKLLVAPGIILTAAWLLAHRWKDPNLAIAAVLPNAVGLAAVTAHNLMIAIAGKKPKPVKRRCGWNFEKSYYAIADEDPAEAQTRDT